MTVSLSNRTLLRGMVAGAVVFAAAACSRSDRTESGGENSAAVVPDTSSNAAQPSAGGTVTAQPSTSAQSNTPRAKIAPLGDDTAEATADVGAETGAVADSADTTGNAGRIRPTENSTETEAVDETADEQVLRR